MILRHHFKLQPFCDPMKLGSNAFTCLLNMSSSIPNKYYGPFSVEIVFHVFEGGAIPTFISEDRSLLQSPDSLTPGTGKGLHKLEFSELWGKMTGSSGK